MNSYLFLLSLLLLSCGVNKRDFDSKNKDLEFNSLINTNDDSLPSVNNYYNRLFVDTSLHKLHKNVVKCYGMNFYSIDCLNDAYLLNERDSLNDFGYLFLSSYHFSQKNLDSAIYYTKKHAENTIGSGGSPFIMLSRLYDLKGNDSLSMISLENSVKFSFIHRDYLKNLEYSFLYYLKKKHINKATIILNEIISNRKLDDNLLISEFKIEFYEILLEIDKKNIDDSDVFININDEKLKNYSLIYYYFKKKEFNRVANILKEVDVEDYYLRYILGALEKEKGNSYCEYWKIEELVPNEFIFFIVLNNIDCEFNN